MITADWSRGRVASLAFIWLCLELMLAGWHMSLAWSDIMLHIRGKLTAFSPLIPLQHSHTVFPSNQLARLYLYNPGSERREMEDPSSALLLLCPATQPGCVSYLGGGTCLRLVLLQILEQDND